MSTGTRRWPDEPGEAPMPDPEQAITIANEFTTIRVHKVFTRNGERLEVHSPKLGFTVRLDPLELECLTWQPPETFSELLESPYGPEEGVDDIRPLTDLMAPEALMTPGAQT